MTGYGWERTFIELVATSAFGEIVLQNSLIDGCLGSANLTGESAQRVFCTVTALLCGLRCFLEA